MKLVCTSIGCAVRDFSGFSEFGILGSDKTDLLLVVRVRVPLCDVTEADLSLRVVGGRTISSSVSERTSRGKATFSIRRWYSLRLSLLTRSAIFLFLSLKIWRFTSSINFLQYDNYLHVCMLYCITIQLKYRSTWYTHNKTHICLGQEMNWKI